MRIIPSVSLVEQNDEISEISDLESNPTSKVSSTASSSLSMAYDEMADVPVQAIDPVEQLQKNLVHLQELQARMKFMMREVRYMMKL